MAHCCISCSRLFAEGSGAVWVRGVRPERCANHRQATDGRRVHQMWSVEMWPCRMDFSPLAWAEIRLIGWVNLNYALGVLGHTSAGWLIGSSTFRASVWKSL